MKVAFVNQPWNYCPQPRAGSIAIWTLETATRLRRADQVVVFSRRGVGFPAQERIGHLLHRRFPVEWDLRAIDALERLHIGRFLPTPLFASSVYYLGYARHVAKDIAGLGCDIVHVHNFSQFIPIIRARAPAARIVLHMHCEWLTQLDFRMVWRRISKADLVVGCSDYITDTIRARFPDLAGRMRTIVNGVDAERFDLPAERPERDCTAGPRLLFVGRISPEKGLHTLLDAFALVQREFPTAQLRIVGPEASTPPQFLVDLAEAGSEVRRLHRFYDGSYLAQLRAAVPLPLRRLVSFPGAQAQSDLVREYQQADILVNPSFSESFGMALIEAMSCGLPVVCSRVGGMSELIEPGRTGHLVDPGDASALAGAIIDLAGSPARRRAMGAEGRKRVLGKYTWGHVAESLEDSYATLAV